MDRVPINVEVDREHAVRLTWADGRVDAFGVADLRANCPCAECRGAREKGRVPGAGPVPARIADAELTGAWGLSLIWADGHSTGIYSWDLFAGWIDADTDDAAGPAQ